MVLESFSLFFDRCDDKAKTPRDTASVCLLRRLDAARARIAPAIRALTRVHVNVSINALAVAVDNVFTSEVSDVGTRTLLSLYLRYSLMKTLPSII